MQIRTRCNTEYRLKNKKQQIIETCNNLLAISIKEILKNYGYDFEKCEFNVIEGIIELKYKNEVILSYKNPVCTTTEIGHIYSFELIKGPDYLCYNKIIKMLNNNI